MLDEEQAFLNAILAEPDDDTVRLVYADWLEEHGRAETAEFIRLQIELECVARGEWSDALQQLHVRMSALYRLHLTAYFQGYTSEERKRVNLQFERGFPELLDVREGIPSDYRVLRYLRDVRSVWIYQGTITEEILSGNRALQTTRCPEDCPRTVHPLSA